MTPTFSMDSTTFQRDLREYVALQSKSIPEALNRTMKDIIIRWYNGIPVADRAKIVSELRRVIFVASKRKYKSGKIRLIKKNMGTQLIYAIVNSRRREDGLPGLQGAEMEAAAQKEIGRRLKAVGALRSGLRGALKSFGNEAVSIVKVKTPGYGYPAKVGKSVALAGYNLHIKRDGKDHIDPRVEAALSVAFQSKHQDLLGWIAVEHLKNAKATNLS